MKSSAIIGIIVAIIVIAGVAWFATRPSAGTPATSATSTQPQGSSDQSAGTGQTTQSTTTTTTTVQTTAPAAQHFTVNGNDATADVKTITVPAGTPVTITFGADAGTTYHGGLDFRSSVVNTGTITPGSTKAVTFTATKSFSFTPYWPATNIAKPYTISVVVQ